jgi:hypothetical protein
VSMRILWRPEAAGRAPGKSATPTGRTSTKGVANYVPEWSDLVTRVLERE